MQREQQDSGTGASLHLLLSLCSQHLQKAVNYPLEFWGVHLGLSGYHLQGSPLQMMGAELIFVLMVAFSLP